jgi:hypothetical protein
VQEVGLQDPVPTEASDKGRPDPIETVHLVCAERQFGDPLGTFEVPFPSVIQGLIKTDVRGAVEEHATGPADGSKCFLGQAEVRSGQVARQRHQASAQRLQLLSRHDTTQGLPQTGLPLLDAGRADQAVQFGDVGAAEQTQGHLASEESSDSSDEDFGHR